eukprot:Anaeramoba_ignava/c20623_g1_i1.p2 GENE.c20623_g1_i1~~c20623_g1_i1.p2  ORF type:complete len:229 (+),score=38.06 c20623_g1_i1:2828-3514(+)
MDFQVRLDEQKIMDYLGKPEFQDENIYPHPGPGVVPGLSWTPYGGSVIFIETIFSDLQSNIINKGKSDKKDSMYHKQGSLKITGRLGNVMKESTQIAFSFAKQFLNKLDPKNKNFERSLHMHIPHGAAPKDGPSAGITMVTSLLSLAMQKPVKPGYAMTGEVTLTGLVLPIGGLQEKVIAAKRAGIFFVILPRDNINEWDRINPIIKQGISPVFVQTFQQVFDEIFEK